MKEARIAVVGVCATGKTTLAGGLARLGYIAWSVPQEHSFVKRLWEKLHPEVNVLVMLDAHWETTKRRRPEISYGPERLEQQRLRLEPARESCDLYLPTDDLAIEQVLETVTQWVETWKERV